MEKNYILEKTPFRFVITSDASLKGRNGCFTYDKKGTVEHFTIAINHKIIKNKKNPQPFENVIRHELTHLAYYLLNEYNQEDIKRNIPDSDFTGDIISEIVATTNEIYGEGIEKLAKKIFNDTANYYAEFYEEINKSTNKLEVKND